MSTLGVAVEVTHLSTELGSTLAATFDAMLRGDVAYSKVRHSNDVSSPGNAQLGHTGALGLPLQGGVFAACSALSLTWYNPDLTLEDHVAAWLSSENDLIGVYTNACTASTYAVIAAAESVAQGAMQLATAVSFRNIEPSTHALFKSGKALSQTATSRPFSRERDGLMFGSAGGVLRIENASNDVDRVTIVSYGISADGLDDVKPHPQGSGMSVAIQKAMQAAGIAAEDLAFICPHGTATPSNDKAEGAAIVTALGPKARDIPMFATKAYIGHSLEATGLVEVALSAEALMRGVIPGYPHTPEGGFVDGPRAVEVAEKLDVRKKYALSLNAAFGGSNVAIVLKCERNIT